SGFHDLNIRTVIFVAFALLIRVPVYLLSLVGSHVERRGQIVIAWYGPSGLSSLLLILLPVFAGIPGSDQLFRISTLVVLISIVIHGFTPTLLARYCSKDKAEVTPEPEPAEIRSLPVIESRSTESVGTQSITLQEFDGLQKSGENVILLDVRTERSREP